MDGDASFNLSIYRDNKRKSGWRIIPSFAIELKARDLPLLKKKNGYTATQKLIKLDPWFVTGFADAEGCFSISLVRKNKLKVGWEVKIRFQINLHQNRYE